MFETYWIYTNEGVKAGEFETTGTDDWFYIRRCFFSRCRQLRINPSAHNYCIAAE